MKTRIIQGVLSLLIMSLSFASSSYAGGAKVEKARKAIPQSWIEANTVLLCKVVNGQLKIVNKLRGEFADEKVLAQSKIAKMLTSKKSMNGEEVLLFVYFEDYSGTAFTRVNKGSMTIVEYVGGEAVFHSYSLKKFEKLLKEHTDKGLPLAPKKK